MKRPDSQAPALQVVAMKKKSAGKKRISHLLPELRRRIPALFDLGVPCERISDDLGVHRLDALEEVVRDMRRVGPRREARVISMSRMSGGAA